MTRRRIGTAAILVVAFFGIATGVFLWLRPAPPDPVADLLRARRSQLPLSPRQVEALIEALAQPGHEPYLRRALREENESALLAAVVTAIRRLGDQGAVPDLIARFRTFAVSHEGALSGDHIAALLADWRVESAVDPLLEQPVFYFPHGAEPPLARMGMEAIRKLILIAGSAEDPRRNRAANVVRQVANPEARPLLVRALREGPPELRAAAACALGFCGRDAVSEAGLSEASEDPRPFVALAATVAVLRLDPEGRPLRVLPLLSATEELRLIHGCALAAQYGVAEAEPRLLELLDHESERVRVAAALALEIRGLVSLSAGAKSADRSELKITGAIRATLVFRDPGAMEELSRRFGEAP